MVTKVSGVGDPLPLVITRDPVTTIACKLSSFAPCAPDAGSALAVVVIRPHVAAKSATNVFAIFKAPLPFEYRHRFVLFFLPNRERGPHAFLRFATRLTTAHDLNQRPESQPSEETRGRGVGYASGG